MPEKELEINSEDYIKTFLLRLELLVANGNICTLQTDDGRWILCEIWHFPERRETDPDNEHVIYPVARFLNDEETAELSMEGQTPEREELVWCKHCDKLKPMDNCDSINGIGNGEVICKPCQAKRKKTEINE